eukprot:1161200-Pelagomonas_calceolata.AAC.1
MGPLGTMLRFLIHSVNFSTPRDQRARAGYGRNLAQPATHPLAADDGSSGGSRRRSSSHPHQIKHQGERLRYAAQLVELEHENCAAR